MDIRKSGSVASRRGAARSFTGDVISDTITEGVPPSRLRAVQVSFAPGARTVWHSHPLGQTLLIVHGVGRVQSQAGAVREVHPGDVVWFAPGEIHWHGASPANAMVHIAMLESSDGITSEWLHPVSDEEYGAEPASK